MSLKKKPQSFNDGLVSIYSITNKAEPGKKPVKKLDKKKYSLRLENRTVGVTRFYAAKQNNERIDLLIRCPFRKDVSTDDMAILQDNTQFEIKQIQYPTDVDIPVMDLSLERIGNEYGYV